MLLECDYDKRLGANELEDFTNNNNVLESSESSSK